MSSTTRCHRVEIRKDIGTAEGTRRSQGEEMASGDVFPDWRDFRAGEQIGGWEISQDFCKDLEISKFSK